MPKTRATAQCAQNARPSANSEEQQRPIETVPRTRATAQYRWCRVLDVLDVLNYFTLHKKTVPFFMYWMYYITLHYKASKYENAHTPFVLNGLRAPF